MNARRTLWTAGIVVLMAAVTLAYFAFGNGDIEPPLPDLETLEPPVANALREAAASVEANPDSAEAWGRLGSILDVHDLRAEAIVCYEQAERLDPDEFRWPYFLGICRRVGDQTGALEDFERAYRVDPDYAPLEVYRGNLLLGLEQLSQAEAAFRRAGELAPSLIRPYIGLAKVSLARSEPDEALHHLEQALKLGPRQGEAHWLLAEAYRRSGNGAAAERHTRVAQGLGNLEPLLDPLREELRWKEGVSIRWRRARSEGYRSQGRLSELVAEWQEAAREYPDSAEVQFELGLAYAESQQFAEAQEHYRRAIALQPDHAKAYQNMGTALAAQGKTAEALEALTQALELDPELHEARYNLGGLLVGEGQTETGLEHLRQAVAAMPEQADAQLSLAMTLTRLGGVTEALAAFEQLLSVHPDHIRARFEYAVLLARLGRLDEASDAFQIVAYAAPEQVGAHANLVRALQALKQRRKAIESCRTGLRHHPQDKQLRQRLAWLLATSPEPDLRNGPEALTLATSLCEETKYRNVLHLDTLAAACAETGDFDSAVSHLERALAHLELQRPDDEETRRAIDARLSGYRMNRPHVDERGLAPPSGPLVVRVTGDAYEWHVAYPGGDGVHGTTDDKHTRGSVHAPAGRPVVIELRSRDLLYTFGIPQLDIKEIAVPDLVYTVEFTPGDSGTFVLRGDQLCGYRHESLIGELVVESPVELERWLSSLPHGNS
jgi:tetratricopeptide (TPR) repeat protein